MQIEERRCPSPTLLRMEVERQSSRSESEGGDAEFFEVDVTDEAEVRQMIGDIVGHWGGLHLAYNNAGIEGQRVRLHETSTEHWHRVMSVNVDGISFA